MQKSKIPNPKPKSRSWNLRSLSCRRFSVGDTVGLTRITSTIKVHLASGDFRILIRVFVHLLQFLHGCFCFWISKKNTSPHLLKPPNIPSLSFAFARVYWITHQVINCNRQILKEKLAVSSLQICAQISTMQNLFCHWCNHRHT